MKILLTTALHAVAILSLSVSGCSDSHGEEGCPELCEQTASCPGSTQSEDRCLSACQSTESAVESAGCEEEGESYLECRSHADASCDEAAANDECSVQLQARTECMKPWCDSNPGKCPE